MEWGILVKKGNVAQTDGWVGGRTNEILDMILGWWEGGGAHGTWTDGWIYGTGELNGRGACGILIWLGTTTFVFDIADEVLLP